jgi:prepilin-type processing-associated H-X9-DG protein
MKKVMPALIIILSIPIAVYIIITGYIFLFLREPGMTGPKRRISCQNNLSQIIKAIKMYTMDYGESYPTHIPPTQIGETDYKDLGILYPGYVTSLDVFTCPSSGDKMPSRQDPSGARDNKPFPPEEAKHVSYAYGLDKNARNKAWTEAAPLTTRVIADRHATRTLTKRSNHKTDGRNVAFVDGHLTWISGKAPLDSDPENPDPTKHGTGPDWWSER